MTRNRRFALALIVGALIVAAGCFHSSSVGDSRPAGALNTATATRTILNRLAVAPGGDMAGYDRARFGQPWRDTDGNGCDQRSDVLARDGVVTRDSRQHCQITAIVLLDIYTGKRLDRTRDIQIDHVVSLGAAWRSGAATWTDTDRERFATDKTNLLAVDGSTNRAKSDQEPDTWKPPRHEAWCLYAKVSITTSDSYRLSITASTKAALTLMLDTCGE